MPIIQNPDQPSLDEAIKRSLLATCQFLIIKKGTVEFPEPNGCGVLFEYNNNYYCLSNAHVLGDEKFGKTFILSVNNEKIILGGQSFSTQLPISGSRNDDPFDIAIIKLSDATVDKLRQVGYNFINFTEIKTGYNLMADDVVFIIGFPGNKTKIDNINKKVMGEPFLSRTIPFLADLSKIGFPIAFHHIVKYSRNILLDSKTKENKIGPKPYGLSGSGVWLISQDQNFRYKHILIGIFSEYLANRALLIGTKIDLYIDLIKQKFDPSIINNGITIDLGNEQTP